ncbi:MAG: hypothetical protein HC860_18720 [Alkalinema sp. RU_4_3]|nr:hypothetical protein [Alkalinema sp. RU_4_3]NJR70433.1 hypothetical protein [Synechococcales cyanobacterium CRU_2_2]
MLWILCILIGLILGQYIRLDVNPKALDFAHTVWEVLKTLDIKGAIANLQMSPLPRQVETALDRAEVTTATEHTEKTPKAIAAKTAKQSEKLTIKAE